MADRNSSYWSRKEEFERTGKWPVYIRKDGTSKGKPPLSAKQQAPVTPEPEPTLFDDAGAQEGSSKLKANPGCGCMGGHN